MKLLLPLLFCISMGASCQSKTQLSFNFALGRTAFFYSHGNGSDPFSVSVELEAKNKIGYIQFRQSFFEDQPIFNNYANPGHNQIEWIEQLAAHVYFLKTGNIKATAGGAIQYQWGKLLRDNRFRLFPEMSLYYSIDERVSAFTRESWFHFREDNRLGFMIGLNCKIRRK